MLLELAGSWRMGRGRGGSPRLVVDEATRLFRLSQKGIRFCLRSSPLSTNDQAETINDARQSVSSTYHILVRIQNQN